MQHVDRTSHQGWYGGASRRHTCWHMPGRESSPCSGETQCHRSCACSSRPGPSALTWSTGTASPHCESLQDACLELMMSPHEQVTLTQLIVTQLCMRHARLSCKLLGDKIDLRGTTHTCYNTFDWNLCWCLQGMFFILQCYFTRQASACSLRR